MINSLKDYFTYIATQLKKHPFYFILILWAIFIIPKYYFGVINPEDYNQYESIYLGGSWLDIFQSVFNITSPELILFIFIVFGVMQEEFIFRYWINNISHLSKAFWARLFFCSFVGYNLVNIPFLTYDIISNNYDAKSSMAYFDYDIKSLLVVLSSFGFYIVIGSLIYTLIKILSMILRKYSINFKIWEFLSHHKQSLYISSAVFFVFSHHPISTFVQYGFLPFVFAILIRLIIPIIHYNYNLRVSIFFHILWNYSIFYEIYYNIPVYDLFLYNVTYWTIFAFLTYNLWRSVQQFDNKKLITNLQTQQQPL
jgi:hypothetical protein